MSAPRKTFGEIAPTAYLAARCHPGTSGGRVLAGPFRSNHRAVERVPAIPKKQAYFLATSHPTASFASPIGAADSAAGALFGALRKNASTAPIRSMIAEMVNALW